VVEITAIGIDMAFANMGLARTRITQDGDLVMVRCDDLELINTTSMDRKSVRKSSDELRRAKELQAAMVKFCKGADLAFVEVPSGSQSASAARALGIAVGVLASCPILIIEVSPMEVKDVVSGGNRKIKITKPMMIEWASKKWKLAPWLRHKGRLTLNNEHLADAMAAVMAGINTPEFKRLLTLVTKDEATSTYSVRPTPGRRSLLRI